jgi:hypothetical protein
MDSRVDPAARAAAMASLAASIVVDGSAAVADLDEEWGGLDDAMEAAADPLASAAASAGVSLLIAGSAAEAAAMSVAWDATGGRQDLMAASFASATGPEAAGSDMFQSALGGGLEASRASGGAAGGWAGASMIANALLDIAPPEPASPRKHDDDDEAGSQGSFESLDASEHGQWIGEPTVVQDHFRLSPDPAGGTASSASGAGAGAAGGAGAGVVRIRMQAHRHRGRHARYRSMDPIHAGSQLQFAPLVAAGETLLQAVQTEPFLVSRAAAVPPAVVAMRLRLALEALSVRVHLGHDTPPARSTDASMMMRATGLNARVERLQVPGSQSGTAGDDDADESHPHTLQRVAVTLGDIIVEDAISTSEVRRVLSSLASATIADGQAGTGPSHPDMLQLRADLYPEALLDAYRPPWREDEAPSDPAPSSTRTRVIRAHATASITARLSISVQPLRVVVGPQTVAYGRAVAALAALSAARHCGWPLAAALSVTPSDRPNPSKPDGFRLELLHTAALQLVVDARPGGSASADGIAVRALRPVLEALQLLDGSESAPLQKAGLARLARLVDNDGCAGFIDLAGLARSPTTAKRVRQSLSLDGVLSSVQRLLSILPLERVDLRLPMVLHPRPASDATALAGIIYSADRDSLTASDAAAMVFSAWSSDIVRRQVTSCLAGLSTPLLPIRRIADTGAEVARAFSGPRDAYGATDGSGRPSRELLLPGAGDDAPFHRFAAVAGRASAGVVRSAAVLARAITVEALRAATGAVRAADSAIGAAGSAVAASSGSGEDDTLVVALPLAAVDHGGSMRADGFVRHDTHRAIPLTIIRPVHGATRAVIGLLRSMRRHVSALGPGASGIEAQRQREQAALLKPVE